MTELTVDTGAVEALASTLSAHNLTRLELANGSLRIVLERMGNNASLGYVPGDSSNASTTVAKTANKTANMVLASQEDETDSSTACVKPNPANQKIITAPVVGVAYRSAEPGAEPLVKLGSCVQAGQAVCLIEAMKMFSEVPATFAGTILEIHFEDGKLVEYGAPLFTLEVAPEPVVKPTNA